MATKPHLTHVALWTNDIDRAIEFYRKYCGLKIVHERGERGASRVAWMGEERRHPQFVIVLIERPFERSSPDAFAHFGFSCRSRTDVDALADDARANGCLALEPRDAGPIVGYHCVINDPDGNPVEFSYGQAIDPEFFDTGSPPKGRPKSRRAKPAARPAPRRRPSRGRKR